MNEEIRQSVESNKDHTNRQEKRRKAKEAILDWWKENQQANDIHEVEENCSIEEAIYNTFTKDSYN